MFTVCLLPEHERRARLPLHGYPPLLSWPDHDTADQLATAGVQFVYPDEDIPSHVNASADGCGLAQCGTCGAPAMPTQAPDDRYDDVLDSPGSLIVALHPRWSHNEPCGHGIPTDPDRAMAESISLTGNNNQPHSVAAWLLTWAHHLNRPPGQEHDGPPGRFFNPTTGTVEPAWANPETLINPLTGGTVR